MPAFADFTAEIRHGSAFVLSFAIERGEPPTPEPLAGYTGWRFLAKRHWLDADADALISLSEADGGWVFSTGRVDVYGTGLETRTLPNRRHRLYAALQAILDGEPVEVAQGMLELTAEGVLATS